ncbi:MAG: hypothetical protein PHR35_01190 [Kiritimatiellae bacterium]|nr:hypothetical protein [Kiritimatiellia bacterium]
MVWEARSTVVVVVVLLGTPMSATTISAADWPPLPDAGNTVTQSVDGRTIERFTHHSRGQWGYDVPQSNYFFLVHPKTKPAGSAPLCVVLHSANRTGFDYLGYNFLNRKVDPADDPGDISGKAPADFYALYLDSNNAEWWGWASVSNDATRYSKEPTSTEKRVLDTIEWVATTYNVDRNRIYLSGISMGGCGSLGIGLPNGDVFAAVRVWVPAGTGYVACRMGFSSGPSADVPQARKDVWRKRISGVGRPDPPYVVDFSSQSDGWSKDQDVLLNAAREGHLPMVVGWGPFGHVGSHSPVGKYPPCAAVLALPWLEIRKNEAYPVFTRASSDQRCPWLNKPGGFDESGQINAYFRWRSMKDAPSVFAMRLWLEHPTAGGASSNAPVESVADITLRRLQQFRVIPNKPYAWRLVRGEKPVGSGVIESDVAGLLTIPKVTITRVAMELHLKPVAETK